MKKIFAIIAIVMLFAACSSDVVTAPFEDNQNYIYNCGTTECSIRCETFDGEIHYLSEETVESDSIAYKTCYELK